MPMYTTLQPYVPLAVKMEELALHQTLVTVWLDILETDVKIVCWQFNFEPSTCSCILHYTILAICSLGCENGGTCTAPDTCDCVAGYTGDRCESRMLAL